MRQNTCSNQPILLASFDINKSYKPEIIIYKNTNLVSLIQQFVKTHNLKQPAKQVILNVLIHKLQQLNENKQQKVNLKKDKSNNSRLSNKQNEEYSRRETYEKWKQKRKEVINMNKKFKNTIIQTRLKVISKSKENVKKKREKSEQIVRKNKKCNNNMDGQRLPIRIKQNQLNFDCKRLCKNNGEEVKSKKQQNNRYVNIECNILRFTGQDLDRQFNNQYNLIRQNRLNGNYVKYLFQILSEYNKDGDLSDWGLSDTLMDQMQKLIRYINNGGFQSIDYGIFKDLIYKYERYGQIIKTLEEQKKIEG